MSDTLVVSGGGRITVAAADLLVAAEHCRLLAERIEAIAASLAAEPALARESADLEDIASRLRATGVLLAVALDAYSLTEAGIARFSAEAVEAAAYWGGHLAPALLALTPPGVLLAVATLAVGSAATARTSFPGALSDERLVSAVRLLAGGADDALRGAARVPWAVSQLADDGGAGFAGREAAAAVLLRGLTVAGGSPIGPIRLTSTAPTPTRAPRSLTELADRIPSSGIGGPQVRVERYPAGRDEVVAVYIAGTADFGLDAGADPWDLRSDVAAMSGERGDAVAATAAALREADVGPDDVVVLVGYSQGGLVASRLAQSGDYRVGGVVTLGSPGANVPVPDGVPVLAVEHAEDLVPALAGPVPAAGSAVTVTRSLYDGRAPESPRAVPAHELGRYRSTLALADRSEEARVARVRAEVLGRFPSGSGTAVEVRAERVR